MDECSTSNLSVRIDDGVGMNRNVRTDHAARTNDGTGSNPRTCADGGGWINAGIRRNSQRWQRLAGEEQVQHRDHCQISVVHFNEAAARGIMAAHFNSAGHNRSAGA